MAEEKKFFYDETLPELSQVNVNGTTFNVKDAKSRDDIAAEVTRATTEEAKKVDKQVTGTNGTAYIFNETDGGGAKFVHTDGTESFVGVNDGGASGLAAQIYADKYVDGKWQGAKLDVTNGGMYYTVGNKSFAERAVADNEVATKGNISTSVNTEKTRAEAAEATLQSNIDAEEARAIAVESNKTTQKITNANGDSLIMNESDGGGIFFVKNDNTSKSFIGVNDSTAGGPDAQIYAINPSDSNNGAKLDILKTGMYYTVGSEPYASRVVETNEIATKGVVDTKVAAEASARAAADALKVDRATDLGSGAKSYVSNNVGDGGACLKVENSTNYSAVAVNNDASGGLGAQVYDWKMNGTSYESGTVIDVTDSKIYYYKGAYQARSLRDTDANEIAVKGDISAEATAREAADNTLQANINSEASARESADTTLQTNINTEATTRAAADNALDARIQNLEARGRFLSAYNSNTGLPTTYPTVPTGTTEYTYTFKSGDYYIVETADDGTKYEPTGTSISTSDGGATWTVGKAVSTKEIGVGDYFTFDGTNWIWIQNSQKTVSFSQIAGAARDNANLKSELEALEAADTAEASARAAEDAKKVDRLTTLSDGSKSYVSNNVGDDGACLKVENDTNWSAVSVNNDDAGGLGAQVYDWKMSGTTYQSGTVLDVTDSKIYYYKGAYQARSARDTDANEIATVGTVNTEADKKLDKATASVAGVVFGSDQAITADELKSALDLKALSHKDNASGSTTLSTIDSITMNEVTVSGNATVTHTATAATISREDYTPAGSITGTAIASATIGVALKYTSTDATLTRADYTPVGSINASTQSFLVKGYKIEATNTSEILSITTIGASDTDFWASAVTGASFEGTKETGLKVTNVAYDKASVDTAEFFPVAANLGFSGTKETDLKVTAVTYDKADATAAYSTTVTPTVASYTRTGKQISITVS